MILVLKQWLHQRIQLGGPSIVHFLLKKNWLGNWKSPAELNEGKYEIIWKKAGNFMHFSLNVFIVPLIHFSEIKKVLTSSTFYIDGAPRELRWTFTTTDVHFLVCLLYFRVWVRYVLHVWIRASPESVSPKSSFNSFSKLLDGCLKSSVGYTFTDLVRLWPGMYTCEISWDKILKLSAVQRVIIRRWFIYLVILYMWTRKPFSSSLCPLTLYLSLYRSAGMPGVLLQ